MSEEITSGLSLNEQPALRHPNLIAAFGGWPDAGEVATGSLRYLVAKLNARRLGHIDADTYYDYGTARPVVAIERGAIQSLRNPASDLFYWRNPDEDRDLLILLAVEPQLRWKRYVRTILNLIRALNVEVFLSLGGLFDVVPHTATPRVSGLATSAEWRERLVGQGISLSEYQGPSSIHTSLLLACQESGIPSASLWGHAPHYVRTAANPKVCHSLLSHASRLLSLTLDLEDLAVAGEFLDESLDRMLAQHDELRRYVQKLQEQHEGTRERTSDPLEDTERIIRDVERFLRGDGRQGNEE